MEPMEEVLLEELRVSQNQRRPEAYLMTQITYSESTIVACTQSRKTNSFYECVLKIAFTKSTFLAQNALNIVWRPGYVRTRWEAYSAPQTS